MDIHRGDRFTTLVAMDTESFVGKQYVENLTGKEPKEFRNGDHGNEAKIYNSYYIYSRYDSTNDILCFRKDYSI